MAKNLTTGLQRGLRQSIAGGLGTGDLFSTASLDLQFARHKSLDSRVTHTRQSSATYVDGDGVIRTAVTNLVTYSEEFDGPSYSYGTRLTVDPNTAVAPNGTFTADKIIATSNNDQKYGQSLADVVSGFQYVFSLYAKKDEYEVLQLQVSNTNFTGTLPYANFDLANGSLGSFADCLSIIEPAGNGWYRCSIALSAATSSGSNPFRFSPYASGDPGRLASYAGDGTSGIYIWGAQLEESSTVGQYVKTTTAINSAPRFDHDPTTGESLGLLVEESRQNLLLQSEDFSTTWTSINATVTTNQIASPNGTVTADLMSDNGSTPARVRQQVSVVSGQTYTASIYLKAGSQDSVFWREDNEDLLGVEVNLATGQITSGTGTIEPVGDGWYRVSFSGSVSSSGFWPEVRLTSPGTVYLWGAQLEAGSFPTSYIPTEGLQVTRAADVTSITGTNFSSWYEQSEGTNLIEFREPDRSSTRTPRSFSDGTSSNRWDAFLSSTSTANHRVVISNAQNNPSNLTLSVGNLLNKHVIAVGSPNANAACNGTLATSSTSSAVPSVNRLIIGADSIGNTPFTGTIRRLTYWPTRLSNDTLQTITR